MDSAAPEIYETETGLVTFETGSEGSTIMGFRLTTIFIDVNNIIVRRNFFWSLVLGRGIGSVPVSNVLITGNYIDGPYSSHRIGLDNTFNNIVFSNNFIGTKIPTKNAVGTVFSNNIFTRDAPISANENLVIENNIFLNASVNIRSNNVIRNNLATGDIGSANGNISNVDPNAIFIQDPQATTDGQWQLSASSPARGAGLNGEDLGIFGGNDPYVLSGMPPLPHVFDVEHPVVIKLSDGLPVRAKVRLGN